MPKLTVYVSEEQLSALERLAEYYTAQDREAGTEAAPWTIDDIAGALMIHAIEQRASVVTLDKQAFWRHDARRREVGQ